MIAKLKAAVTGAVDSLVGKKPPAEKSPAQAAGLTPLVVWSVPKINRTLLICHKPGEDGSNPMNLVNVQVRDNALFLKAMALNARHVQDRRYILEGRLPRWRGKW